MPDYDKLTEQDLINIRNFIDTASNASASAQPKNNARVEIRDVFNENKQRMMKDKMGAWVVAPEAPKLFDAAGNPVDETGNPIVSPKEPRGKVVDNAGELDYEGIKGLVNQLNNMIRPAARKAASLTSVGGVGVGVADTIQGIKDKQFSDNPLSRLLSDTTKKVKKSVASIGQGEATSLEDKLGAFLTEKYPELAKKAPKDTLRINSPEPRGLKRFSGIGEVKSPYGRFIIDEAGTLRKV